MARLEELGDEKRRAFNAKRGAGDNQFGVKTGDIRKLAKEMGVSPKAIALKVEELHESNPMLGHRGCRLGITFPDIYDMQARAIFEATIEGFEVHLFGTGRY